MTRKDLKKHWHILKALKKGWIEPSDVEYYYWQVNDWLNENSLSNILMRVSEGIEIRLTKEGKEKINASLDALHNKANAKRIANHKK